MGTFDPAVLLLSPRNPSAVFSAEKLLKRQPVSIDPGYTNPAIGRARRSLENHLSELFAKQREKAVDAARRILSAHWAHDHARLGKAQSETDEAAEGIYAAIKAEFDALPRDAREWLETSALEGAAKGLNDIRVSDEGLIDACNAVARDWAKERAAEMVGKRLTIDGELVDNPNARWVISESTRDDLRQIVVRAFEAEGPIESTVAEIKAAGAFSDARAANIARTEISQAQVKGNWGVWERVGVVGKVRWLTSSLNPCETCEGNEDDVVDFGEPFPSGDVSPLAHVNCMCILIAEEIIEPGE